MIENIPKDPFLLLSFVNLKLRDFYASLDDMCQSLDISKEELIKKMSEIDYEYDKKTNQFV